MFDEFVIVGNSALLKCQTPQGAHVRANLEFIGWTKDDRFIATLAQNQYQNSQKSASTGKIYIYLIN